MAESRRGYWLLIALENALIINASRADEVLGELELDGLLAATNIPNDFYLSGVWRQGDLAVAVN